MVDFSKTIIYTIRCLNGTILEFYVGGTVDFTSRKNKHKQACNNEKNTGHHLLIYKTIRENGGWDNWVMAPYEEFKECKSDMQSRIREEQVRVVLNSNLNTRRAYLGDDERREQMCILQKKHNILKNAPTNLCACGKYYSYANKKRHIKSKYHLEKML